MNDDEPRRGARVGGVIGGAAYAAALATILATSACREPYAIITLADPAGYARGAVSLRTGDQAGSGRRLALRGRDADGLSITLVGGSTGARIVWVEALDGEGGALARGAQTVAFRTNGSQATVLELYAVCDGPAAIEGAPCLRSGPTDRAICAGGACVDSSCGDGYVDAAHGEECEPGEPAVVCWDDCVLNVCGDGAPGGDEECDDGDAVDQNACRNDCLLNRCNDERWFIGVEACEDGNLNANDGCDLCASTGWHATVAVGLGNIGGDQELVELNLPRALAVGRDGVTYLAEEGRVLRLEADGVATRLAGTGVAGISGDGGPAELAEVAPVALAVDGTGDLYLLEDGSDVVPPVGGRLRRVDRFGTISTIAGGGVQPADYAGPALGAQLYNPTDLALDGAGRVCLAEANQPRVRCLDTRTGMLTVDVVGPSPSALAFDAAGRLHLHGTDHRVYQEGATTTPVAVAGNGAACSPPGDCLDGQPPLSVLLWNDCRRMAFAPDGTLYILGRTIGAVRRIRFTAGVAEEVGTLAWGDATGPTPACSEASTPEATLIFPTGLAVTLGGELLIADTNNDRVVEVSVGSPAPALCRWAGSGAAASRDGMLGAAYPLSNSIGGLAVTPSGDLFFSDSAAGRIMVLEAATGLVRHVAGSGFTCAVGSCPDGGPARAASFGWVGELLYDAGRNLLYVSDPGDRRVRRVRFGLDWTDGTMEPVAGSSAVCRSLQSTDVDPCADVATAAEVRFVRPAGLALDPSGNLYVADMMRHRIVQIQADAGGALSAASPARRYIGWPCNDGVIEYGGYDLCCGQADCTCEDGSCNPTPHAPGYLNGCACGLDHLIADLVCNGLPPDLFSNAGICGASTEGDYVQFDRPGGLWWDPNGLLVADTRNGRVRRVSPGPPPVVEELYFTGSLAIELADVAAHPTLGALGGVQAAVRRTNGVTVAGGATFGFAGDDGPPLAARLGLVQHVAVTDDGAVVVASTAQGSTLPTIRRVNPTLTAIHTVVGQVYPHDGPLAFASLGVPGPLVADPAQPDRLLIADRLDGRLRALDLTGGTLETLAGYPNGPTADGGVAAFGRYLAQPEGVAADPSSGDLFLTEASSGVISRLAADGRLWLFAGQPGAPGYAAGPPAVARFDTPRGLWFDAARRHLYVADSGNHLVRRLEVDNPAAPVEELAGTPRIFGLVTTDEGTAAGSTLLNEPVALALGGDGGLYVAERANHRVRRIAPHPDGTLDGSAAITTIIGTGVPSSSGEGAPATIAGLEAPAGLAVDRWGNLFVTSTRTVRVVAGGADGVATGEDAVLTIFGRTPIAGVPETLHCLSGVLLGTSGAADDDRLWLTDACSGLLLRLDRERLAPP